MADVVATMLHAVDDLDWPVVRRSFTTQVTTDYTSLWGGTVDTMAADDLVGWWQQLVPGYDATQHLIGPVVVSEASEHTATCTTNVRGYHHIVDDSGAATWMAAGRYVIDLASGPDGWKISGIAFLLAYEEGSRELVETARERTAARKGGRTGQ